MKKLLLIILPAILLFSACSEELLDTVPSDAVSGTQLLGDVEKAQVALDGVYRVLYLPNSERFGTVGNVQQNFGIVSHNLVADLMGEDMVMSGPGSGWFWYDYIMDVHGRAHLTSWRPYGLWNFYYKIITNVNYIIAAEATMEGSETAVKNIVGQAYALRGYAYFYLAQFFQQAYTVDATAPGVPIYTEPTTPESAGKGRGTLAEVYTQLVSDLEIAEEYLENAPKALHRSHIDYSVVRAIQSKVYLTMENFPAAAAAAKDARESSGRKVTPKADLTSGFNDLKLASVLWGGEVIATEAVSGGWGTFFCHWDPGLTPATYNANGYGTSARKCIDKGLYDLIPVSDLRKAGWFKGALAEDEDKGPNHSYVQMKYYYKDVSDYTGDYIYLRYEEMLLNEAEALVRQATPDYAAAKELLKELATERYADVSDYETRLATFTDANTYHSNTRLAPTTLLDEILFQRRVELWGEAGRLFDLKRLDLGYTRIYTDTNHPTPAQLPNLNTNARANRFCIPIPQTEFDGNEALEIGRDQNPI